MSIFVIDDNTHGTWDEFRSGSFTRPWMNNIN